MGLYTAVGASGGRGATPTVVRLTPHLTQGGSCRDQEEGWVFSPASFA